MGVLEQMARHLGTVLRVLDMSIHRSNIGSLGFPRFVPSTSTSCKETKETMKEEIDNN